MRGDKYLKANLRRKDYVKKRNIQRQERTMILNGTRPDWEDKPSAVRFPKSKKW